MREQRFHEYKSLVFRIHALRQMFQRTISEEEVRVILAKGFIIENYPDDTPYPRCLVSGRAGGRPLHIVMAYNNVDCEAIVITAYEPEATMWSPDFSRRRT
jgi:hypothetical protein